MTIAKTPLRAAGAATAFAAASAVLGLLITFVPTSASSLLVLLALIFAAAIAIEPLSALLPFLFVEEYYRGAPALRGAPGLVTFGHAFYEVSLLGVPICVIVVMLGFVSALARATDRRVTTNAFLVAACGLAVLAGGLYVHSGPAPLVHRISGGIRTAAPWIECVAVYLLVRYRMSSRTGYARLAGFVVAAVAIKAAIGLALEATSGGYTFGAQSNLIYYDAATPALAAALLVHFITSDRRVGIRSAALAFAAAVIVVVSFRRSVWIAVPIGVFVISLVRLRGQTVARVGFAIAATLVVVSLLPGRVTSVATARVNEMVAAVSGRADPSATAYEHEADVKVGFQLAKSHPLSGFGVTALQPAGLTVPEGNQLYVHNEFLQDWLRYGLVGLLLIAALTFRLTLKGVGLVRTSADSARTIAAKAAIVLPIPLLTAPFIATTHRWPALVAVTAALLFGEVNGGVQRPAQEAAK